MLLVILAVGAIRFEVIVTLAVEVQPLAPVAVTVYVPGDVILTEAVLPNPLSHEYETPPVAVRLITDVLQVIIEVPLLLMILVFGTTVLDVIVTLAVDEHPLALETVTTYVPAVFKFTVADSPKPLFHE